MGDWKKGLRIKAKFYSNVTVYGLRFYSKIYCEELMKYSIIVYENLNFNVIN